MGARRVASFFHAHTSRTSRRNPSVSPRPRPFTVAIPQQQLTDLPNARRDIDRAYRKLELLCAPGRALVHDCMSLFTRVVLRKDAALYGAAGNGFSVDHRIEVDSGELA